MFNFLAVLDIRVFGRLHLWLLIGLALFLQPGCFLFSIYIYTSRIPMQEAPKASERIVRKVAVH